MSIESGVFQQRLDGTDGRSISQFPSDLNQSQTSQTARHRAEISWLPSMNVGAESATSSRDLPAPAWARSNSPASDVTAQAPAPEQRPTRIRLEDLPAPAWNKAKTVPDQQRAQQGEVQHPEVQHLATQQLATQHLETPNMEVQSVQRLNAQQGIAPLAEAQQQTASAYRTADSTTEAARTRHLIPDAAVLSRQNGQPEIGSAQRQPPGEGIGSGFGDQADRQRAVERMVALAQNLPEERRRAVIASLYPAAAINTSD